MANARMAGDKDRMKFYRDQVDTDLEANGLDEVQIKRLNDEVGITKLKEISDLVFPDSVDYWIAKTRYERVAAVAQIAEAERQGKPDVSRSKKLDQILFKIPTGLKRQLIEVLEDCGWERLQNGRRVKHGLVNKAMAEMLARADRGKG